MLKTRKFYLTTLNHYLLASDKAGYDTHTGGKVMTIVPMNSVVFVTKIGRLRFLQVVYQDMVGYIWLYTNKPTSFMLAPINEEC